MQGVGKYRQLRFPRTGKKPKSGIVKDTIIIIVIVIVIVIINMVIIRIKSLMPVK